jgi:transposase
MGAPVSSEIRAAIVRAHREQKLSYVAIAELLGVCESTVTRVLRRHRKTGSVAPSPRGGGNFSPIDGKLAELLHAIVATMPDATVVELTEALIRGGRVQTSRSSVQRALARMGYSRKKSHSWRRSATRRSTASGGERSARGSR